ncbi:hypothetical protein ACGTN6_20725, partial [Halomonas sp. THAF12]|uniref:hypothetical protein n=1 Tax=Halomonas sp. B23F22_10 TaxID=3459515 RepID=UPI00373E7144
GSFNFNLDNNIINLDEAYILMGGLGFVFIGLYWMEGQGWIKVNNKAVKLGMIGIFAYLIGKWIFKGSWRFLM